MELRNAIYIGLDRIGTAYAIIVIPPEYSPAAPAPAIARPMMRVMELCATAQTIEPTISWLANLKLPFPYELTFENYQCSDICPLDVEICIDLAESRLQRSRTQQIC